MKNESLNQFVRNEYSQFGEDGIIENIIGKISNLDKWCVEFGAWDGIYLSNTYNLIKNKSYKSVLIEADKKKFQVLKKNMKNYDATLINEFVSFSGNNTLDQILTKTAIPKNFDFLSIDIDGNDYWIFESLRLYRPKIICIEYNPSIPNEVEFIQPRDFSINRGASALSICKLAEKKLYTLVATTRCNLIFVDNIYIKLFNSEEKSLFDLRDDSEIKVFAFSGYDGTILLSRPAYLMWHDFKFKQDELQIIPGMLRKFPSNYNLFQKSLFLAFLFYRSPSETLKRIHNKIKRTNFRNLIKLYINSLITRKNKN